MKKWPARSASHNAEPALERHSVKEEPMKSLNGTVPLGEHNPAGPHSDTNKLMFFAELVGANMQHDPKMFSYAADFLADPALQEVRS